jgi:acetyl-CoA carboxylase carboxyltransferase component
MRYTGYNVGIIGNRIPVINGDEASKGAQFIRQCNQMYVRDGRLTTPEITH